MFLPVWCRASAAFALLSNTRKTELPSAALIRVFLASLVARTAPFALLAANRGYNGRSIRGALDSPDSRIPMNNPIRLAVLCALFSLPLAAGPREFGIAQFQAALAELGLKPEVFRLRYELNHDPPQSWRIEPSRITGGDLAGLMYGLMEAAAQIRFTGRLAPASGTPFLPVRRALVHVPAQLPDQLNPAWLQLLERLAKDRFNRLQVIIEHPSQHEEFLRELAKEAAGYAIEVQPRLWRPASPGNSLQPGSLLHRADSSVWADPLSIRAWLTQAALDGHQGFEVELSIPSKELARTTELGVAENARVSGGLVGRAGPVRAYEQQLWGRLGYDLTVKDQIFLEDFETRFGKNAAPDVWEAFTNASRYRQLAEPPPRFFASAAEAARARLDGTPTARIAPLTLAGDLYGYALRAQQALDRAKVKLGEDHAEWKRVEPGLRKQVTATRLLARKLSIEDFVATFRLTGNDSALYAVSRLAMAASKLAEELGETYSPPALDESSARVSGPLFYPEPFPMPEVQHKPPRRVVAGETSTLSLAFASPRHIRSVRLHYATGGAGLEFHTMEAAVPGSGPIANFEVIPSQRLVYYFEIINDGHTGWFYPDPIQAAHLFSVHVQSTFQLKDEPGGDAGITGTK